MLPIRYDDLGTINAVKLLPIIESYSGYILLYTEIDSHIEEGDNVFISFSGDTSDYPESGILLDNFIAMNRNADFMYSQYSTGYRVIYVNKNDNSFAIYKTIDSILPITKIYNHYVSKCAINNINFTGNYSTIDSTLFRNIDLSETDITWVQGVVFGGDISDITITSKYESNYISLNLTYTDPGYTKVASLNNNTFGYSYFYDLDHSIKDCNIENGWFENCNIKSTDGKHEITNGFYKECVINNTDILNGYFKDTDLQTDVSWKYGSWDSIHNFQLPVWEDGLFLDGVFGVSEDEGSGGETTWKNGYFLNGVFQGNYWENGKFQNGIFYGTTWVDESTLQNKSTIWYDGSFNGGVMSGRSNSQYDIIVYNGSFNGGEMENVIFTDSKLNGVSIKTSTIKKSEITNESDISSSIIFNTTIYDGIFNDVRISDSKFPPTTESVIENSEFLFNNEIRKGTFNNNTFVSPVEIDGGSFFNNSFKIETKSGQKGLLTSKRLRNSSSGVNEDVIYMNFIHGHNYTINDTGKIIKLEGFNAVDLNGQTFNIAENDYSVTTPTGMTGVVPDYPPYPSVGENYILLEGTFLQYYQGQIGFVTTVDDNLYEIDGDIIINNGRFVIDDFDNVTVNNGNFVNTNMHNGTSFYGGNFRGGTFASVMDETIIEPENNWYGGNFYSGQFGSRRGGNFNSTYIEITSGGTQIISDSVTPYNGITLEEIFPLSVTHPWSPINVDGDGDGDDINVVGDSFPVGGAWTPTDPLGVFTYYLINTHDMDLEVWSGVSSTYLSLLPYKIVFKLKIDNDLSKLQFKEWIEQYSILQSTDNKSIEIIDLNFSKINPLTASTNIYETFNDLYDIPAESVGISINERSENRRDKGYYFSEIIDRTDVSDDVFLIFESEHIKKLWFDASETERQGYSDNFRNTWSVANTGYYTHPLPVLSKIPNVSGGTEDIDGVTNYSLFTDGSTIVEQDTKWIYGTQIPPWWTYTTNNNIYLSTTYDINWDSGTTIINSFWYQTPTIFNGENVEQYQIVVSGTTNDNTIQSGTTVELSEDVIHFNENVNDLSDTSLLQPFSSSFKTWMDYHIKHKNEVGKVSGATIFIYEHNFLEPSIDWDTGLTWENTPGVSSWTSHNSGSNDPLTIQVDDDSPYLTGADMQFTITYCGVIKVKFFYVGFIFHNNELEGGLNAMTEDVNENRTKITVDQSHVFHGDETQRNGELQLPGIIYDESSEINLKLSYIKILNFNTVHTGPIRRDQRDVDYCIIYYAELLKYKSISEYDPNYIVTDSGLSWYGLPQIEQDIIYNNDTIVKLEDNENNYNYNLQDGALFEAYWRYRRGYNKTLSATLQDETLYDLYYNNETVVSSSNVALNSLASYNLENTLQHNYFSNEEKRSFKKWNEKIQTSSINFNRTAGIQFPTINNPVDRSAFRDYFHSGLFYDGIFAGSFEGGVWRSGKWLGWNGTVVPSGATSNDNPLETGFSIQIPDVPYYPNINELMKKKKYYKIPPWKIMRSTENLKLSKNLPDKSKNKKFKK